MGKPSHDVLILIGQVLTLLGHLSSHMSRYSANRFLPHFGSFKTVLPPVGFLVRVFPVTRMLLAYVTRARYEVTNLVHVIHTDLLYKII